MKKPRHLTILVLLLGIIGLVGCASPAAEDAAAPAAQPDPTGRPQLIEFYADW